MDNHFLAEVLAITKKRGSGKAPVISELSVTENGTYEAPTGVDGYSPVTVDVSPVVSQLTVTENGTYEAPSGVDGYTPVIVNVPTGGAAIPQSGASFIDYDGSLVKHYTKEEFLALSAMPSNPSHTGLVAQGWNWSLADAQAYMQKYGSLIIGQMYTTDTGETRIYIHIDKDTPQNRLTFYVRFTSSVADNVDIDWGDGTIETKGSTSATNYPHTYATGGDYIIKLKVNTGTISFVGDGTLATSGYSIYGDRSNTFSYNRGRIRRVEIGDNVFSIGGSAFAFCYSLAAITIPYGLDIISYAFVNCYSLIAITIPEGVTSIGNNLFSNCYSLTTIAIPADISIGSYAFNNCYSLIAITIPDGVTSFGGNTFSNCNCLSSITIPDGMTSIAGYAFNSCIALTSITIPDSMTSIEAYVFLNCYGISEYHLLPTTPPTLVNTNAFASIANDCVFYVPYSEDHSILAAYQAASNWSNYASRMVEEPQP